MGELGRKDELTFRANQVAGRHGWLRLTPAYGLHLVHELVGQGGKRQRVLDPFDGTGTTPLVCAQQGIRACGVDINPFLVWLAALKCRPFDEEGVRAFERAGADVLLRARRSTATLARLWTPPIKNVEKWWGPDALLGLARLHAVVRRVQGSLYEGTRDLLLVALCRSVIQVANVSFGHQSMSFRKGGAQALLPFPDDPVAAVFDAFEVAVAATAASLREPPPLTGDARIVLGDARALPAAVGRRTFTTVVTSPPYPNRMSYVRELRPYMYWLGYLGDAKAAGALDWEAIGGTWGSATSNLAAWAPDPSVPVPHAAFEDTVGAISAKSALLGPYVHKYFEDTVLHVRSLRRVLARGARVHYVVGNSRFYDVLLPTEAIYASILTAAGFRDVEVRTIRKRTSKKELFEFVVEGTWPPHGPDRDRASGEPRHP